MDLQLFLRVAWRFRLLVAAGLLLALTLTLLSVVRIDLGSGSLAYREQEQWTSDATLLLTEPGFPYGKSVADEGASSSARFAELATVYSGLATSDEVRRLMRREGPVGDDAILQAAPVTIPGKDIYLPMLNVSVVASSPQHGDDTHRPRRARVSRVRPRRAASRGASPRRSAWCCKSSSVPRRPRSCKDAR